MKLAPLKRENILQAAEEMDRSGETPWTEYWMYVAEKQKEYPFKPIVRRAYEIATGTVIDPHFFQSNVGYRHYVAEKFSYSILFRVRDNIPFFTSEDIMYFAAQAGKPYRKDDRESQATGDKIKKTIFAKTNTWARALNLDGFEVKMDNNWLRTGYFAGYSWARIYRASDRNKKIFFTVGVDAEEEALIYKLHCYYSSYNPDNALSADQLKIFDRIVKTTDAKWQQIPAEELEEMSWEELIGITREFIEHYTPLYDEVIRAVWGEAAVFDDIRDLLIEKPVPTGIGINTPSKKPLAYASNADYDQENKRKKEIGDQGEKLVIRLERQYLQNLGKYDLAAAVGKVLDWEGFDIQSYYADGRPKKIEVKTTVGTKERPFFWTQNEYRTMLENVESYCLYRLYNYDAQNNAAEYYKLEGDISNQVEMAPVQYSVLPK